MINPTFFDHCKPPRMWAVLAVAAALVAPELAAQERHSLPGSEVTIYNLAGKVRIAGGSGSDVVVEITRGGADAARLSIEKGRIEERGTEWESLRVIYPADRIIYPALGGHSHITLRVSDNGTFYGKDDRWGDKVSIESSGSGLEAHADLLISVPRGKRVRVALAAGEATVTNVDGDIEVDVGSSPVSATGTKGSLNLDTGSGSISVRGAEGTVNLDTGSGRVEVHDVKGPELLVDTGSGSVSGSNIDVRTLNVDTGSGRVEIDDVRAGSVLIDTGSGGVRIGLLTKVREMEIDTGSGGVTVTVPSDFGAALEIETGSGSIDVDVGPISDLKTERGYFRGRVGDGSGRVVIDTGSGGVHIARR